MPKDWIGNNRSIFTQLGAKNYAQKERETNDYYATEPKALELLLDIEKFNKNVWECACGEGHLSEVLKKRGYIVRSTDLIDRGYGQGGVDFLEVKEKFDGDIITNPPYKFAQDFVEHALKLIYDGNRIAMFLKIQFLEGKSRRRIFDEHPPKIVYITSSRLKCAMNGDFENVKSSAVCYAWFIWEKGYKGEPVIKWFN